mgnify:CR=1 FL=1
MNSINCTTSASRIEPYSFGGKIILQILSRVVSSSSVKNYPGFLENRHDQSVYSLLCKKYNLKSFSAYECEWAYLNNERTWQHNKDSPILAKRDLKYSILTRFLRRQKKNLRRLFLS